MTNIVRGGISALIAIAVTFALFYLMQFLISGEPKLTDREDIASIRFGDVELDPEVQTKQRRKPQKPPPPKEPPPPPKMNVQNVNKPLNPLPNLNMPDLDVPMSGSGPFLGSFQDIDQNAEGDIIPLVRIQPQYPRRALMAKIEGWVDVEFTITETGSVTDPSVVDSEPPRVFDRDALRSILKWKFKPRVVDGVAVPRKAQTRIEFKLAEE